MKFKHHPFSQEIILKLFADFLKGAQVRGRTWDVLGFSFIFSHNCSALDHSATAPPPSCLLTYHELSN